MKLSNKELKIEHPRKASFLYYMCLLDWGGVILDEAKHKVIAKSIMPDGQQTDGWRIMWNESDQLKEYGVKSRFLSGFYHSRLILRFELTSCPETISIVREIRQAVEGFVEKYLIDTISTLSSKHAGVSPKAFIYPVFELVANCPLWRFAQTSPYTLPTTCFYTNLTDLGQPRWSFLQFPWLRTVAKAFFPATVKMRISGAKLITAPMSEWFLWNLTNLIYHEGLYRQSREQQGKKRTVYKGLELRLEDFADRLITSFSQSITNVVVRTLNWWLVLLTILLVALAVSLMVVSIVQN